MPLPDMEPVSPIHTFLLPNPASTIAPWNNMKIRIRLHDYHITKILMKDEKHCRKYFKYNQLYCGSTPLLPLLSLETNQGWLDLWNFCGLHIVCSRNNYNYMIIICSFAIMSRCKYELLLMSLSTVGCSAINVSKIWTSNFVLIFWLFYTHQWVYLSYKIWSISR